MEPDTPPSPKIPKIVLGRGCKKGSKSRQLFWQDNGLPATTVRLSVVMPTPTAGKLRRLAELSGEKQSQLLSSLVDNHSPDPGLFMTPPIVLAEEDRTLDGRPDYWMRMQGGFIRPAELHRLRPFLARNNISVFSLFRHWLRTISEDALNRECGRAATNESVEPEPNIKTPC